MKSILLVDDERAFLLSLRDGLMASGSAFNVVLAGDGREALQVLKTQSIDLLVTDLKLPVVDGFQLLAYVSRHYPSLPVIVMTAFGTPDIEERLARMNALHYLEKPLDFDALAETIESALATGARSYIRGITLATFLQLVRMEQKTCSLKIRSGKKTGYLFIRQGELFDALTREEQGKTAALDIVAWDDAEIEMDNVCRRTKKAIDASLDFILMEAYRIKDEANRPPDEPLSEVAEAERGEEGPSAEPPATAAPQGRVSEPEVPLVATLRSLQGVRSFAIFDEVGFLEHQSEEPDSLIQLDPKLFLAPCLAVGAQMDCRTLRYLMFTTEGRDRYLFLARERRQIVLSLAKGARPEQILDELSPSLFEAR
jgi:CheY-like chemotaxis protein